MTDLLFVPPVVWRKGRLAVVSTLKWSFKIEDSPIYELRKRKLYVTPLLLYFTRDFISIQVSSASAERLFRDAGFQEGSRRQHENDTVTEILRSIRSYVESCILDSDGQKTSPLSSRVEIINPITVQKKGSKYAIFESHFLGIQSIIQ